MAPEQLLVSNDETDFYGKKYWLEHQVDAFGYGNIYTRARNDLTERNLHWLKALLKYRLPPAKVLELGCAHGSLVALLKLAGYQSSGIEMSPWVVAFGKKIFDIPIYTGPVESIDLDRSSFDVIVLMDVLEHLIDPASTMRRCLELLRPDGLLLIQTPKFKRGISYQSLVESKDRFVEMLIPDEHIYLFSEYSIKEFFRRLGVDYVSFEPAIFAHYDMFVAVSRLPLIPNTFENIESALLSTPQGRISLALLDLRQRELDLTEKLSEAEMDRSARGEQIATLSGMLKASQVELENRKQFKRSAPGARSLPLSWFNRLWTHNIPDSSKQRKHNSLNVIAVDLTPVLPGGDNGGAKIFVLELVLRLAEMAPQTRFILLTQSTTHEELSILDRPNVQRVMVIGPVVNSVRPRVRSFVSVISSHLPNRIKLRAGRVVYQLNAFLKRRASSSLLRDLDVDLLFCPFTAPTYSEAGIPTVSVIYDLQYKAYPDFFSVEDVIHRDRTFIEACKHATLLTAISDFSRNSALAHGDLDSSRVRTIHLRIAQRALVEPDNLDETLNRFGLRPRRYFLYPANFWKHKNHEMLFTAFGMACKEGLAEDIKLVCTGAPGPRHQWLMSAVQNMNLSDRIILPGYVPSHDLVALLVEANAVIFPSLYEGFGLPVIEAMAAGVPVACSNITSLPEVAADAALLFDPRVPEQIMHSMISLVEDEALRARLIVSGRQRAAEFLDTERMAKEYWDAFLYATAIEKHQSLVTGIYNDGWAGPALHIQAAPAQTAQTLQIEFSAPSWLARSKVMIQASYGGKLYGMPFEVVRGVNAVWSTNVEPAGGHYELRITPTFIPFHTGLGEDHRELSLLVRRCFISRGDSHIELFPGKVSA